MPSLSSKKDGHQQAGVKPAASIRVLLQIQYNDAEGIAALRTGPPHAKQVAFLRVHDLEEIVHRADSLAVHLEDDVAAEQSRLVGGAPVIEPVHDHAFGLLRDAELAR